MAGAYAATVEQLCAAPLHAGDPSAGAGPLLEAEVAAPERGAWVRLAVRTRDGTVSEARYRAWGCPHVLAACEYAASWLEGRPAAGAGGLTAAALAQALGAPAAKMGRLLVVEDALAALAAAAGTSQ